MQNTNRRPNQRRESQQETQFDINIWIIGGIVAVAVICLAISIILLSSISGGILPTRASQAEVDITFWLKLGLETNV